MYYISIRYSIFAMFFKNFSLTVFIFTSFLSLNSDSLGAQEKKSKSYCEKVYHTFLRNNTSFSIEKYEKYLKDCSDTNSGLDVIDKNKLCTDSCININISCIKAEKTSTDTVKSECPKSYEMCIDDCFLSDKIEKHTKKIMQEVQKRCNRKFGNNANLMTSCINLITTDINVCKSNINTSKDLIAENKITTFVDCAKSAIKKGLKSLK